MIMRLLLNILLAASLLAVGALVWAGQQRTPDRYLQDIRQRGVLRVGLDPTYPPFESLQGGQYVGYDINLARAIASDLGVKAQFVPLALDTQYDALEAGKVDMLISALPIIPERQTIARYSLPYFQAGQMLVVRAGEGAIGSAADLNGRKVGVELGSPADTEARLLARTSVPGMRLQSTYTSPEDAMNALLRGEVDAVIADGVSVQAFQRAHPGRAAVVLPPLTDEPYVVASPAQATQLGTRVDELIERLRTSGELAKLMGSSP